jgi:hypothetical protein
MPLSTWVILLDSHYEEMFQRTCKQQQIVFAIVVASVNTLTLFNANELKLIIGQSVNWDVGVLDVCGTMWAILGLFKTLTNFNELVAIVVFTI